MSLQDDLDKAVTALGEGRTFTYKGKKYSLTALRDELIPMLRTEVEGQEGRMASRARAAAVEAETTETAKQQTKLAIDRAKKKLRSAENNLNQVRTDFKNGVITEAQYQTALALPGRIKSDIADMEAGRVVGQTVGYDDYQVISERTTASAVVGADTDTASRAAAQNIRSREADPNTVGVKSKKIIIKNGVEVEQIVYNDGRITEIATGNKTPSSSTDRPTGGTPTSVTPAKPGEPVDALSATDWENTFKQYFPAKAWLLTDLDRTKYPQLFDLLKRAHDLKYYDTTEGRARFAAELDGTDYYKELASSGKVRQIKSIVGDLGFESTDFSRFVTQAINFGWDDNRLKQETYREVFRRNPDGTYANPTAVARTRQSNEFLSVSLIAKNFFNQASEDTITKVLTGDITTEDFQRQQRTIAKTRYSHLSDLIDQGVTLEDLASNYKTSAAKLLEVDPNSIDMSDAQYEIALAYDGDGGKRTMTTGEWERLLRTDARYGWERTENAKSEARSLASNIAQAFGRII